MDDATLLSVSAAAGVLPNPALVRDSAALATAASSHVGHLFQRDGSLALPDGELLLLQLPTRLPVREALDHSQAAYEFDATIPPEARPSGGQQASGGSAAAPAAGLDERQRAALDEARGLGHRRMDPHGLRDSWAKAGSGGRLGTLRVHASGKVTLVVGDVTLDVASGTIMRHAVDAAVITTSTVQVPPEDGEEGDAGVSKRVGDMHMLGRVTHKLVATPSLEGMLPAWATKAGMVEAASQSNREHEKLAASLPGAIGRAPPATSAPQSKATSALLEGSDSDEDAVLG
ncbi:POLR3D [Symbiodinium sp. KB8]|nr:POLR3D [Symbiodinium sp. KB8]